MKAPEMRWAKLGRIADDVMPHTGPKVTHGARAPDPPKRARVFNFVRDPPRHVQTTGITNARTEGTNRLAKDLVRRACSFRNTDNHDRRTVAPHPSRQNSACQPVSSDSLIKDRRAAKPAVRRDCTDQRGSGRANHRITTKNRSDCAARIRADGG